jgi:RHS repeat-associated protein
VNSSDGSLTITPVTLLPNLNQYLLNMTTTLSEGSSTNNGVTFGATITSSTFGATTTLKFQVEVEPTSTGFLGIPNATSSSFLSPGSNATATFLGPAGGYHWQAREINASGTATAWEVFGPGATSTDFILNNTFIENYTGSVANITIPNHVLSLALVANGGQGANGTGTYAAGGGYGGGASGTLPSPTGTYYYYVGAQGGGGTGGGGSGGSQTGAGGAGGGMTWFSTTSTFNQSNVIIVGAGGGGGGGGGGSYSEGPLGTGGGGGSAGGTTGGSGGNGGGGLTMPGGGGGSQSAGGTGSSSSGCQTGGGSGSASSGGNGAASSANNYQGSGGGGGGGGGNGYYGGGGGAAVAACSYTVGGAGGGGGASFITSSLSATSTAAGTNSGNGSLSITENLDPTPVLSSSSQYLSNGTATLGEGSSTNKSTVVFGAALNSWTGRNVQLQVEVEPTGTAFTNTPNENSLFVLPGNVATTSFTGTNGGYHWQARVIDVQNNVSAWHLFGPNSTSTDFILAVPTLAFTLPTSGTTTPYFSNWGLKATNVTSTTSYQLQVLWDTTTGGPMQSSTITASGTALMAGVNVSHPTSSLDYTYDGTIVPINATGTLSSGTSTIATTTVAFSEQTTVASLNCGSTTIQCLSYKYDNDGNITQVTDQSAVSSSIVMNYTYDGLNRLLTASSSGAASGGNYRYTYSYDPVGNILSSPAGTYTYGGGSNYTDPDAVTKIVNGSTTTTFAYDNDGNLASSSNRFAYTWDYNNRMTAATKSGTSTTYGYDFTGERVLSQTGTSTPTYDPQVFYSVTGGTATKSILAGSALTATIVGSGTSSVPYVVLTDNLNNATVLTNASGSVSEVMSYYPFGSLRLDQQSGINNRKKYTSQDFDAITGFTYDNARYLNTGQGQFISEDPMFLGNQRNQNLADPQSLNAYSYGEDNPIVKSDPSGKCLEDLCIGETALAIAVIEETSPEWEPVVQEGFSDMQASADAAAESFNAMFESGGSGGDISLIDHSTLEARTEQEDLSWLRTRPILNGAPGEEVMASLDVSSLVLKGGIYAGLVSAATIGVGYLAFQGVSNFEDFDPTHPIATTYQNNSTPQSSLSANNGNNTGSRSSSFSGGSSYGSTLSQLESTLNQLQETLAQLQSIINNKS